MKALEITRPGEARLVDRPQPQAGAGEALLRVRRIGYCGTDLSTFRGANPLVAYPRVPGHEIAATIESLGPGVAGDWRPGLDVLVTPYTHCGKCAACACGRFNCCAANQTLGVQRDGALAQWIVAPVEKLIVAPRLSLTELALVEPLTVGFHAAGRGRVAAGETVAVIGCGAIGLGVTAGAHFRGAEVIAIDVEDAKLELARACGATHTINSQRENLHDRLRELSGGHGPRVVVEAVGLPATYRTAVEEVSFAGRIVCLGYAKAPVELETKLFVLKELDVVGSRNALPADFADVVRMLQAGRFPADRVVTSTVGLDEAPAALKLWSENPATVTKIHVTLD
ncbi:MAG TPA: zinc-binding alcohol dehydrogenase family protein [Lacipirellulaceae bacterium]|nr:zinc-binding alcohol dehydrogenase family protein [Lacipirellulaceae bacterium]